MPSTATSPFWREPANALSHFLGLMAAVVGLCILLVKAPPETPKLTAFAIHGASLCALFLASSCYHFFDLGEAGNKLLRRFDHAAIFLLIAGSSVPVHLHFLSGTWRAAMLITVGSAAVLGVLFKMTWFSCPRWLDASMYVAMGWMIVIPSPLLYATMTPEHIGWLAAGGLFYTSGALIYASKRPDPWPGIFGFHEIWHLFVLAGAACHYGLSYSLLLIPHPPF